jgi:hypothetical protein
MTYLKLHGCFCRLAIWARGHSGQTPPSTVSAEGAPEMTPAVAMKAVLWMTFVAAIILTLLIGRIERHYGTGQPTGTNVSANATALARLMTMPKAAAHYVVPILFPLDLLLLASVAAFMMTGSIHFAADVGISERWLWLLLVIPAVYLAADLGENAVLAYILTAQKAMSDPAVAIAQAITRLKWATVSLGALQTFSLMVVSLARSVFGW